MIIISYELLAKLPIEIIQKILYNKFFMETYCDIIFEIDIQCRQEVIIFISKYRRWACAMLLCKWNCHVRKLKYSTRNPLDLASNKIAEKFKQSDWKEKPVTNKNIFETLNTLFFINLTLCNQLYPNAQDFRKSFNYYSQAKHWINLSNSNHISKKNLKKEYYPTANVHQRGRPRITDFYKGKKNH